MGSLAGSNAARQPFAKHANTEQTVPEVLEAEAGDGDTGEFDDEAEAEQVTLEEQNLAKEIAQAEEEGVDPAFCEALESEKEAAAEAERLG